MSDKARDRIFSRLNSTGRRETVSSHEARYLLPAIPKKVRIERLKTLMEAMRTEVHVVNHDKWTETLAEIIKNKGCKDLLYAHGTDMGDAIERFWKDNPGIHPGLIPYDQDIEQFKTRLFDIDAAITSTEGAIADTGAIILWPDEREPRLMSLVPPVHIALLDSDKIYGSLSEVIDKKGWAEKMPTNLLLISGPSKTADIELTLAFGVHGPRELNLIIVV